MYLSDLVGDRDGMSLVNVSTWMRCVTTTISHLQARVFRIVEAT